MTPAYGFLVTGAVTSGKRPASIKRGQKPLCLITRIGKRRTVFAGEKPGTYRRCNRFGGQDRNPGAGIFGFLGPGTGQCDLCGFGGAIGSEKRITCAGIIKENRPAFAGLQQRRGIGDPSAANRRGPNSPIIVGWV